MDMGISKGVVLHIPSKGVTGPPLVEHVAHQAERGEARTGVGGGRWRPAYGGVLYSGQVFYISGCVFS